MSDLFKIVQVCLNEIVFYPSVYFCVKYTPCLQKRRIYPGFFDRAIKGQIMWET